MSKGPTTFSILCAMFLGAFTGILLQYLAPLGADTGTYSEGISLYDQLFRWLHECSLATLKLGSGIFLASLKLLVVPLIYVSLVCGISNLGNTSKLGSLGGLTICLYVITTAIAVTFAICFALLLEPGTGVTLAAETRWIPPQTPTLLNTVLDFFPTNPIKAMADGNTMQIIVFALLSGYALIRLEKEGEALKKIFEQLNILIMKMVEIIINLAPYGVFCLIGEVFHEQGLNTIVPLLKYFLVVSLVLAFQLLIVYQIILYLFTKITPRQFFSKSKQPLIFGFSTSSSNATIPVTLEQACEEFHVPRWIASFTIPLGATINMDGTAVMQGVATVFIAQLFQIEMSTTQYITVIAMATVASIGTAGVPGVGIIMLTMVFQQVGLPLEGIALVLSVDRLLDMMRTSVNIGGDLTITAVVAHLERKKQARENAASQ